MARFDLDSAAIRWRTGWRWIILGAIVACGFFGFLSGVGVTQRPELVGAGALEKLYYTLGLFILGGMDLGTPTGGPALGRAALWIAYFAAPTITASAVIEAALRLIGTDQLLFRRLRDHIVVVGCGRLTLLFLKRLREVQPDAQVLVLAGIEDREHFDTVREVYGAHVLEGDVASDALLLRARLHRAARVLLLTDDDFTNLDAATQILSIAPEVSEHVIVHVSDLRFMRSMAATRLAKRCHIFNGHQIAASHLVHAHLLQHFQRTEPTDLVVLAGFGRFGQTVLDELQREASGSFDRVVIVDLDAEQRSAVFAEQVGFVGDYRREVFDGDLQDPDVWRQIEARVRLDNEEPVFVVGSGIDRTNLRSALSLASRYPKALVIARSDRQWAFAAEVSREAGIHTFSVAQLVTESMPGSWFGPRTHDAPEPMDTTVSKALSGPIPLKKA